jgi:hypothetical protein
MEQLPIVQVSDAVNSKFADLLEAPSASELEVAAAIDTAIFDLYTLTDGERAEIGFIEIR